MSMDDFGPLDTLMATSGGGMYSSNRIDKFAASIVDMLAEEEMSYEEAMLVLHSSESLVNAKAKLEKPVKGLDELPAGAGIGRR